METNTEPTADELELAALTRAMAGQLAASDPYHVVLCHDTQGDDTAGRLGVTPSGRRYVSIDAEHAITLRDATVDTCDPAALARAAAHISATEVAPGIWAHHDDATDHCQCGEWSGSACEWPGPESDTVVVEYMPAHHRASHTAGNRGVWPHNGASRIRVSRQCAALMVATDGEWCSVIGGAS